MNAVANREMTAPIALFVYKRYHHTKLVLESLSRCEGADKSELFIFCDGAKGAQDVKAVEEVRQLVKSRKWCGRTHVIERDKNMGLANSIIKGVTELCEKYGRVIVLEDDLLTSPFFLNYMNSALNRFEDNERVMQISGHMFPVNLKTDTETVFFPFTTSWGWATWHRAWMLFDHNNEAYTRLRKDSDLRHKFDLDGAYPYFRMLMHQNRGKIDSWAIRWYLSVFMQGGLTLYPSQSLIKNIGFDGSGTHCGNSAADDSELEQGFRVSMFPEEIKVSEPAFTECKKYLRTSHRGLVSLIKKSVSVLAGRYLYSKQT